MSYQSVPPEVPQDQHLKPGFQDATTYYSTPSENQQPTHGWPLVPKTLRESTPIWAWRLLPHLALLLIPICFIGLGIAVLRVNGTVESNVGNGVMQAMAVTATLWPIFFAAVLGPMLKAVALYKAERGVKLGILEVLSVSQTLVSTLRGCVALRILSFWPILLVAIWTLSPTGGQGALRAMELRQNFTTFEYPLMSYPVNNIYASAGDLFDSASGGATLLSGFRAQVGAVFFAQDLVLLNANGSSNGFDAAVESAGGEEQVLKITRRDLWRNVRIPFLHLLPAYSDSNRNDWTEVPSNVLPQYSSLIGVPIRGFPSAQSGNTTFTVQSNYQVLACNDWVNTSAWRSKNNDSLILNKMQTPNLVALGLPNIFFDLTQDPARGPFGSLSKEPDTPLTLVFYTRTNLTLCEISTHYVESAVQCSKESSTSDLSCAVTKMRYIPSIGDQGIGKLTALEFGRSYMMLAHIPYTGASSHPFEPSFLEKWLKNPPSMFQTSYSSENWWYEDIDRDVFSSRLSTVLNTFVRASLRSTINVGGDGPSSLRTNDPSWANITGTWIAPTAQVYHLRRSWFLLYFIPTIILTVCGLVNIVLRSWIRVPDFLGSVSALTRDSVFIGVPTPGSMLDGADRARLLKDKWVMVQDVEPEKEVGRIALSDRETLVGLRWERRYV